MIGGNVFSAALRTAYRPFGEVVTNVFDFLAPNYSPRRLLPRVTDPDQAIQRMRAAARHLSAVSETVIADVEPTARQVITQATDEAADFHA